MTGNGPCVFTDSLVDRKRLLALAAQKFISDISQDAFQYCKVRQSGNRSKVGKVSLMAGGVDSIVSLYTLDV
jgi:hypothetical protein